MSYGTNPGNQAPVATVYNREQKGHSIIAHLLLGCFVLWVNVVYITMSPRHYWHA